MRRLTIGAALAASLAAVTGFSTSSRADTGQVAVVFTKGGFIVGVGGGEGVLLYRGHKYPFTVSGMSVGFTIGASTTKLVGRALNLPQAEVLRLHIPNAEPIVLGFNGSFRLLDAPDLYAGWNVPHDSATISA